MKNLSRSKLLIFLAMGLTTIISASACSLALPETSFISNIELTNNSDQILVQISDQDYNNFELIFDIPSMELESANNQEVISQPEIRPSGQNYSSKLFENSTDVFWTLSNSQDNYEFRLTGNATISIQAVSDYMFFVSESLQTAYLILPYDADTSGGIKDSVLYATIVIIPLNSPNSIKYSFVAHSYLTDFFSTNFIVYDDLQLFFLHGNGADCVNSIYFNYDRDSFQFLSQTSAWQDDVIDPRNNKLIVSSFYYQTGISEIKLIDLDNFEETIFQVSDVEILALLSIEKSKSTSSIISSTIDETVSSVLPIFGIYLPLGFVVSLLIVKLKFQNKNQLNVTNMQASKMS